MNAIEISKKPKGAKSQLQTVPSVEALAVPAIAHDLVTISEPQGPRAEAIRALRTHVMAQHVNAGRRALSICAPNEDVGCSFIAANLAVALSQIGVKTLLIDGDLRNPSLDGFFAHRAGEGGLRDCLGSEDVSFAECIEQDVLPNLAILRAGGPAPNAQELLATERFQQLVEVCLRDYDVTIVDTPPASLCADARRISNVIGYSLIVARRHRTLVDDVKTLIIELREDRAQIVGTVLNEV